MSEQLDFFNAVDNTKRVEEKASRTCYCMINGEYGDHTPEEMGINVNQLDNVLEKQRDAYGKYIGKEFGDFTCKKIEYDFGTHRQVWMAVCNFCGKEKKIQNGYQWSRRKTGGMHCDCWLDRRLKAKREKKQEEEAARKARIDEKQKVLDAEIGKLYGHYEVVECYGIGEKGCAVKCVDCGEILRSRTINQLRKGDYPKCKCERNVYNDDPKWIGFRVGHLVSEKVENGVVLCRCDCGRERRVNATRFFKYNAVTRCASSECKYADEAQKKADESRKIGEEFEFMTEVLLHSEGYKTKLVGKAGDYGVDIIATDKEGREIAVQCKCNAHALTGVKAIQEVYAGGRYYDVDRFAIVAFGEVSRNAIKMAKKLGVYISNGKEFVYPENLKEYSTTLVPTIKVPKNEKQRKLYEFNGEWDTLPNWAFKYGTTAYKIREGLSKGLSFENALRYEGKRCGKTYTVNGATGTLTELSKLFNVVSIACTRGRITCGWSVEDALLKPKVVTGRPTKPAKNDKVMEQISFYPPQMCKS